MLLLQKLTGISTSLAVGLLTGALTSTPGLSAAKEAAADTEAVIAGYGIAYIFGVLGVVFFVQLVPKLLHTDMEQARAELLASSEQTPENSTAAAEKKIDPLNLFPIMATIVLGLIIGSIKIPFVHFSLGTSGGILLAGLLLGHLRHIGKIDLRMHAHTLALFRELGLVLFLIGAGVPAGVNFIQHVKISYFVYGIIMTLLPMLIGFLIARFVLKLNLLNCLGAITGGMTSTPALGALISMAETDQVVTAYAATYPIALAALVLTARILCGL